MFRDKFTDSIKASRFLRRALESTGAIILESYRAVLSEWMEFRDVFGGPPHPLPVVDQKYAGTLNVSLWFLWWLRGKQVCCPPLFCAICLTQGGCPFFTFGPNTGITGRLRAQG